ncbi:MAG TPA: hypothetical protein VFV92_16935, partial [Candidatus Bathyarchaeia archaeon]|nr:hypothetical protein [Candidatus Bathyarchaeia archaeon]
LLSKELGGITESMYRTLCVLHPPCRQEISLAPDLAPPGDSSAAPISFDSGTKKQNDRLQQLKGYLKTYQEIQETELLLDSLRAQHNETSVSLQRLVSLEEQRQNIREALEQFQPLGPLVASSLLPQISEYQQALKSKSEEVGQLEARAEEEQARLALIPSTSLFQQRTFLIGGGLLISSFVVAKFFPFLVAGIFVGLGCIAVALTQYLSRSQNRNKIQKGLLALEYQVSTGLDLRISRQFQSLLDLLPSTGCHDVPELAKKLQERDTLTEKLTSLDQKIAELSTGTDRVAMEEKRRKIEEAIQLGEEELRSLGYVPEPHDVQREIEKLEREAVSPEKPLLHPSEHLPQPVDSLQVILDKLLGRLNALQLSAVETLANKLIAQITVERYTQIRRDPEHGLRLVLVGKQGERSLGEVSDGTQCQAMLAWHLALLSAIPQALGVPLLLDDPFLHLDGERRKRLLPFLQALARTHQVILFSHQAWIPSGAAHIVPLARLNDC